MRFTRLPFIFVSLTILAACQPTEPTAATTPLAAPVAPVVTTQEVAAPVAPPKAAAAVTGVVVCDDYLNKYEACLRDKLPQETRAQFQSGLDAMRSSWMQLAANPQTAAALENACVQAKSAAAVAMQSYGCSFE